MITETKLETNFTKKVKCILLEKIKFPTEGNEFPIYIPQYMTDIPSSDEKEESMVFSKGSSVFINDGGCMPQLTNQTIETQNYILAELDYNSSLNNVVEWTNKYKKKGYIDKGTELEVSFKKGVLAKAYCSTDNTIEEDATLDANEDMVDGLVARKPGIDGLVAEKPEIDGLVDQKADIDDLVDQKDNLDYLSSVRSQIEELISQM